MKMFYKTLHKKVDFCELDHCFVFVFAHQNTDDRRELHRATALRTISLSIVRVSSLALCSRKLYQKVLG